MPDKYDSVGQSPHLQYLTKLKQNNEHHQYVSTETPGIVSNSLSVRISIADG